MKEQQTQKTIIVVFALFIMIFSPNSILPLNSVLQHHGSNPATIELGRTVASVFKSPSYSSALAGGDFSGSLGPLLSFSVSGGSYISGGLTNQSDYCAGATYDLVVAGGTTIQVNAVGSADPNNPSAGTELRIGTGGGKNYSYAQGTGTVTASLSNYINYSGGYYASKNYASILYQGSVPCPYNQLYVSFNFHVMPSLTLSLNTSSVQSSQPFLFYGRVIPFDAYMNYSIFLGGALVGGSNSGANNNSASGPNFEGILSEAQPGSYTMTMFASGWALSDTLSVATASVSFTVTNSSNTSTNTSTTSSSSSNSSEFCLLNAGTPKDSGTISSYAEQLQVAGGFLRFNVAVISGQGLVLQDVASAVSGSFVSGQPPTNWFPLFKSISIPIFRVDYGNGAQQFKTVQFAQDTDKHSDLARSDLFGSGYKYSFSFEKYFCGADNLKGTLSITYNYYVRWYVPKCEVLERGCNRIIPTVSFQWTDESADHSQPMLGAFTASQKISYASNTGLALSKDSDYMIPQITPTNLFSSPFRETILTHEQVVVPVVNQQFDPGLLSQSTGVKADSLHPVYPVTGEQTVLVPGCRSGALDCIHEHWRWSGSGSFLGLEVDPMVNAISDEPISEDLRGTPYFFSGESLMFGIVVDRPNEVQPTSIDDLNALASNNEVIATPALVQYIVVSHHPLSPDTTVLTAPVPDPSVLGSVPVDVAKWSLVKVYQVSSGADLFQNGLYLMDNAATVNRWILGTLLNFGQDIFGPSFRTTLSQLQPQNSHVPGDGIQPALERAGIANNSQSAVNATQLQANLTDLEQSGYWMPDNNTLVPGTAGKYLSELASTVSMILQFRSENPQYSGNLSAGALADISRGLALLTYNQIANATNTFYEISLVANQTSAPSDLQGVIANSSQDLTASMQTFVNAMHDDPNVSAKFVTDYASAWKEAQSAPIKNYSVVYSPPGTNSGSDNTTAKTSLTDITGSSTFSITTETGTGNTNPTQIIAPIAAVVIVIVAIAIGGVLLFRNRSKRNQSQPPTATVASPSNDGSIPRAPIGSPQTGPPPSPVLTSHRCSTCGQYLYYFAEYRRYYCSNERKYL